MLPARRFNLPDIFNDFFDNGGIERINTKTPAINVIEGENTYKIEVATPGMTKDDFKVHINRDGNLVIELEKKCECQEEKKGKYIAPHIHLNVTYLFEVEEDVPLRIKEDENSGVMWRNIEDIRADRTEPHMNKLYHKLLNKLNL